MNVCNLHACWHSFSVSYLLVRLNLRSRLHGRENDHECCSNPSGAAAALISQHACMLATRIPPSCHGWTLLEGDRMTQLAYMQLKFQGSICSQPGRRYTDMKCFLLVLVCYNLVRTIEVPSGGYKGGDQCHLHQWGLLPPLGLLLLV